MKKKIPQMKPEDMPDGVTVTLGFDLVGQTYLFEHKDLGPLGRLVVTDLATGQTLLSGDFYEGDKDRNSSNYIQRKKIFGKAISTIDQVFKTNFPGSENPGL